MGLLARVPREGNAGWEFIDALVDTGLDGLHPIQAGVNNLAEIKQRFRDRLALVGTIGCDFPLHRGTLIDTVRSVRRNLEIAKPGGGYIVGTDNSIHADIQVPNLQVMIAVVKKFGRY